MLLKFSLYFILLFFIVLWVLGYMCRSCRIVAHGHIHGKVVCCLHPPFTCVWHFSPYDSSPISPAAAVPLLFPPPSNRLQCVMLPSLCSCVLIVQHLPMTENIWCLIFCSCVSLLKIMVSRFIHVPTKDRNSSFFMTA